MSWAAAITAGTSLVNGYLGNKAAGEQADAAQAGLDFTKQVYGDAQGNFQPYMAAGQQGLTGLDALAGGDYSGFMNSPDYLASQQAGIYALDHSAAARNRLNSGGYEVDLQNAGQNNAAQYLGQYRQSLQYLAGMGQQSVGQLAGIGQQAAGQVANQYGQIGQAQANGLGAWGGAITGIAGAANDYLQATPTTSSSYGGTTGATNQFGMPAYNSGTPTNSGNWYG